MKKLKKCSPIVAALLLVGLALTSKLYLPSDSSIHLKKETLTSQKKSEPFRLIIDIKQATLTPSGINTYTLTFNADYMETITAIALPPNNRAKSLSAYEYRKLAHEGNNNDFDHNPPTVFLHLNNKSAGAYTLYSSIISGKHVIYKLRTSTETDQRAATRAPLKPTTGKAMLFINHLCCL